mmetsp:Transcript_12512/g.35149  ORF Transcript_12512/g.35149 Transcript_12512/m.35149 type:complete len:87 (+) Transcript_12512:469-729(+)
MCTFAAQAVAHVADAAAVRCPDIEGATRGRVAAMVKLRVGSQVVIWCCTHHLNDVLASSMPQQLPSQSNCDLGFCSSQLLAQSLIV